MWQPEDVLAILCGRGELWQAAPGLAGFRGPVAGLLQGVSNALSGLALGETDDDWCVPSGVAFETLECAGYFESFPQWLTAASHLSGDENVLHRVATAESPGTEARQALAPASAALPPAVCYHTYAALAGCTIEPPLIMTAEGTCWRHEGDGLSLLERGWAFRMREIVCIGDTQEVEEFRQRGLARAAALAQAMGIETEVIVATDPFFAPTSRGKALLQRVKSLKHELVMRFPDGRPLAIASFNNHERFFGDAFGITLPGGQAAATACVAFGIERWTLALLVIHGPESSAWPEAVSATGPFTRDLTAAVGAPSWR